VWTVSAAWFSRASSSSGAKRSRLNSSCANSCASDEPTGPIVLKYQSVILDDVVAVGGLGRLEMVANDFEHQIVGRQGKYEHHHPAPARRKDELVG